MKLIVIVCFALCHKLTVVVKKGDTKLVVRTVDTDVDVVAIATLNNIKPDELWVAFDAGVHLWLQSMYYSWYSSSVPRSCRVRHRVVICRHRKKDRPANLGCMPKVTEAYM